MVVNISLRYTDLLNKEFDDVFLSIFAYLNLMNLREIIKFFDNISFSNI